MADKTQKDVVILSFSRPGSLRVNYFVVDEATAVVLYDCKHLVSATEKCGRMGWKVLKTVPTSKAKDYLMDLQTRVAKRQEDIGSDGK